ncbi:MAG: hypothetical protein ACYSWS_10225 [Planctomycetota bacterium]
MSAVSVSWLVGWISAAGINPHMLYCANQLWPFQASHPVLSLLVALVG